MGSHETAKCGIQKPVSISRLFSDMSGMREGVMDAWLGAYLKQDPAGTRCPGRVLRRKAGQKHYRYQVQEASVNTAFGFSTDSIQEDIAQSCTVVVFKQREPEGELFDYWMWDWARQEGKPIGITRQTVNGQRLPMDGISLSETELRVVVSLNTNTAVKDGSIRWKG